MNSPKRLETKDLEFLESIQNKFIDDEEKSIFEEILDKIRNYISFYENDRNKKTSSIKKKRETNVLYARGNPYKANYFRKYIKLTKKLMGEDLHKAREQYFKLKSFAEEFDYLQYFNDAKDLLLTGDDITKLN